MLNDTHQPQFVNRFLGSFTRQQALTQGLLIDVTIAAQRLNYPCAVAISQTLFDQCVKWNRHDCDCQLFQDQALRLSSVLTVAKTAARITGAHVTETEFVLNVIPRDGYSLNKTAKQLKISLSLEDPNTPAITIMLVNDLYQAIVDFTHRAQAELSQGAL